MITSDRPRFTYSVAALGNRMYYQVPRALQEAGVLDLFLTDFYTPDLLYRHRALLPKGLADLLARRHEEQLPSSHVRSALFFREGWRRLSRGPEQVPYVGAMDWKLGSLTSEFCRRRSSGSIIYGMYWPGFAARFGVSERRPNFLWIDHPIPSHVLRITHAARTAGWYESNEPEERLKPNQVEECDRTMREADGILVASEFVREGLVGIGVRESRIAVVPLGGDRLAPPIAGPRGPRSSTSSSIPLKILWVGQPRPRKGFREFLEALARVPADMASVSLVIPSRAGNLRLPDGIPPVRIYRHISGGELHSLYLRHDIFVMPSLYEGFGMVYLEALNAGLPIVATRNTGVARLVTQGIEGWIIDPGDEEALADILEACARDPDIVRGMRLAAARLGARYSWSQFRAGFVAALCRLETSWQDGKDVQASSDNKPC